MLARPAQCLGLTLVLTLVLALGLTLGLTLALTLALTLVLTLALTPGRPRAARRALRRRRQAPSRGAANPRGARSFEPAAALLHLLHEVSVARPGELVGLPEARRSRVSLSSRTSPAWPGA
jgi:hypothetical protein